MTHDTSTAVLVLTVAFSVIALGGAMSLYLGRKTQDSQGWLVAGRSLPLYVLVFTQFATATGGGVLVAHVGIAYSWGWSVFIYEIFVSAGLILLALIAHWLRRKRFATVPDILGSLFGNGKTIKTIATVCSIIVPFGWLVTQFVAFGKLFARITGLPMTPLILLVASASLLVVLPGGLLSVAWTDFLFGVCMLVLSIAIGAYAVIQAGGWTTITERVPPDLWRLPGGLTEVGGATILLWLFSLVPGTLTNQLYYQRIFAAKDIGRVRLSLVLAAIASLIAGVYAFLVGIGVRAMNPNLGESGRELAAGWFLTQLPLWALTIYAAFLMATIVSTTGSALQSVVTNLVRDLYQGIANQRSSERGLLRLSKLCTLGVTAAGAMLACLFPSALDWLVATYAYSAAALTAPIFLGYALRRRKRLRASSALTAMLGGLTGCGIAHALNTNVPYAIYGIAASAICMLLTTDWRGAPTQPNPTPTITSTPDHNGG